MRTQGSPGVFRGTYLLPSVHNCIWIKYLSTVWKRGWERKLKLHKKGGSVNIHCDEYVHWLCFLLIPWNNCLKINTFYSRQNCLLFKWIELATWMGIVRFGPFYANWYWLDGCSVFFFSSADICYGFQASEVKMHWFTYCREGVNIRIKKRKYRTLRLSDVICYQQELEN